MKLGSVGSGPLALVFDTWRKDEDGRIYYKHTSSSWLYDCEKEGEEIHGKIIRSGCG